MLIGGGGVVHPAPFQPPTTDTAFGGSRCPSDGGSRTAPKLSRDRSIRRPALQIKPPLTCRADKGTMVSGLCLMSLGLAKDVPSCSPPFVPVLTMAAWSCGAPGFVPTAPYPHSRALLVGYKLLMWAALEGFWCFLGWCLWKGICSSGYHPPPDAEGAMVGAEGLP